MIGPVSFGRCVRGIVLGLVAGAAAPTWADEPAEPPAMGGDAEPDAEPESAAAALDGKIKAAIEKGVAFLRAQQSPSGTWGNIGTHVKTYAGGSEVYQHPLGPTAMAVYAMLKCEVPVSDGAVKRGLEWLQKSGVQTNTSSYEVSATLLAATATADPFKKRKDSRAAGDKVRLTGPLRKWAADLQVALLQRRSPAAWRYAKNCPDPGGTQDVSATQFALLALAAADRCGIPTDRGVWADAAAYVQTLQEPDGPEEERAVRPRARKPAAAPKPDPDAGRYAKPKPEEAPPKDRARGFHYSIHATVKEEYDKRVTGARTACGVGALALARFALDPGARPPPKGKKFDAPAIDQAIYDGLAWLSVHWHPWTNANGNNKPVFYLYSVERAMDLVGAERLGTHLWYAEMVQELLPKQESNGSWDSKDPQVGDRNPVVDTAFALLFLRRAAAGGVPIPIVTSDDDEPPADNR